MGIAHRQELAWSLRIIGPRFYLDSAFWPSCLFENREDLINPLLRRIWSDLQNHRGDLQWVGVVVTPPSQDTRKSLLTRSVPPLHSVRKDGSIPSDTDLNGTSVGQQSDSERDREHAQR